MLPTIAPTMAPITVPLLGSVEPAAMIGVVVWAAGAKAVVVTGLAVAVIVVVAGLGTAVVVVVAGLTIDVVFVAVALSVSGTEGLGVAAGSVPARSRVVVYVV
jgi:hypothetical protein